jgi:hypothetical protein
MTCLLRSVIYCVFHLRYQVFDSIRICRIFNNDGVEDILHSHKLSTEKNLVYSYVCSTDHNPGTDLKHR